MFIERRKLFFLVEVEHRSEGSRHPLRRTLDELKQKRRVLKNKLQKRIHLWSENFKRPNFIRSRDKISFTIGVSNACFSPLIGKRKKKKKLRKKFSFIVSIHSRTMAAYFAHGLHNSSSVSHHTAIFHL